MPSFRYGLLGTHSQINDSAHMRTLGWTMVLPPYPFGQRLTMCPATAEAVSLTCGDAAQQECVTGSVTRAQQHTLQTCCILAPIVTFRYVCDAPWPDRGFSVLVTELPLVTGSRSARKGDPIKPGTISVSPGPNVTWRF